VRSIDSLSEAVISVSRTDKCAGRAEVLVSGWDRIEAWVRDRVKAWVPDWVEVWVPDRVEVWVPDRVEVWVPDRVEAWVPDRVEAWIPDKPVDRTRGRDVVKGRNKELAAEKVWGADKAWGIRVWDEAHAGKQADRVRGVVRDKDRVTGPGAEGEEISPAA